MKTHIHHLGSATIAISAVLALSSTPLAAQLAPTEPYSGAATATTAPPPATTDAPIVGPVEGNAQPATPVIVAEPLPVEPVPVAEQPVTAEVDASEAASAPAAAAAPTERAAAPAPERAAAPASPAPASEAAPAVTEAPAEAVDEPAAAEFAPVAIAPDTALIAGDAAPAAQPVDRSGEALLAGLLAALGLGALGWGAFALRRRRHIAAKKQQIHVARASAEPKAAAPVAATAPAAPAAPEGPSNIRDWQRPAAEAGITRAAARPVSHGGAAVALPAAEPATFAERDALLRRMVAGSPDRANPFRAPKARLRRARLIVQSLGHRFENGRSWIDLSQYPNNWPELRQNYSAAA